MREILFRGKRTDNGKWVEGYCVYDESGQSTKNSTAYIVHPHKHPCGWQLLPFEVIPESVSEFTGLCDKKGKKIFEGDIVKAQDEIWGSPFCDGITGKIVYDECAYFIEPKNPIESQWLFNECAVYEVIGNIHDNPELLKEGDE